MESLFNYWLEVDQSIHQLYNLGWYRAIHKMASDTTVREERRLARSTPWKLKTRHSHCLVRSINKVGYRVIAKTTTGYWRP
jgi:hypothetical protein